MIADIIDDLIFVLRACDAYVGADTELSDPARQKFHDIITEYVGAGRYLRAHYGKIYGAVLGSAAIGVLSVAGVAGYIVARWAGVVHT